jgi:hypothetical protein
VLGHERSGSLAVPEPAAALKFMTWLLPFQQADGSFGRYCKEAAGWKSCKRSDADDVLTALWVYCVLRYAPDQALWNQSAGRALLQLLRLWDPERQVFRLFANAPDALLIDNLEIVELLASILKPTALKRLSASEPALGTNPLWPLTSTITPSRLRAGMEKTFGIRFAVNPYAERLASPGHLPGVHFYPHLVGPTYVWAANLQPLAAAAPFWRSWWSLAGSAWLNMEADEYPWALVALAAHSLDKKALQQWQTAVCQQRTAARWTVLDEAVWLRVGNAQRCRPAADKKS